MRFSSDRAFHVRFFWVLTALAFVAGSAAKAQQGGGWLLAAPPAPPAPLAEAPSDTTADAGQAGGWMLPASAPVLAVARPSGAGDAPFIPPRRAFAALFQGPTAVVSGFSGTHQRTPLLPTDPAVPAPVKPVEEYRFIDPDGVVLRLTGIDRFGHAPSGTEIKRPAYDLLTAGHLGQVFALAIDTAPEPSLYAGATALFGLQIVVADRDGDGLPERLRRGEAGAVWMQGQWGHDLSAGPGSIWKVDGATGQVSLLTNLRGFGADNPGPGIGQIAHDPARGQLFASDLHSGLIHRISLQGSDLGVFDHGLDGRGAAGLPEVAYSGQRPPPITDPGFDPLNPATWGFAPAPRRVWGMAVHGGRLFYAVAEGLMPRPEIWSVGLDPRTGAFDGAARWEFTLPADLGADEISDMAFGPDGALYLAQRPPLMADFGFASMARVGQAETLRFWRESPDDPLTPSVWAQDRPARYAVGFAGVGAQGLGGLALGPSYDETGVILPGGCSGMIWTTGDDLRLQPALATALLPGGALPVSGVMAQPVSLTRDPNAPPQNTLPWVSYALDFDGDYPENPLWPGRVGDVELTPCAGDGGGGVVGSDGSGGGDPDWLTCRKNPALCPPPAKSCAHVRAELRCDRRTGTFVLQLQPENRTARILDRIKLTDPAASLPGLPREEALPAILDVDLAGKVAGQTGQVALCAFNGAERDQGRPFDCCNSVVTYEIPTTTCAKEVQ